MLGTRLKELREAAELSNRELDRLAGIREGHSWLLEHRESPNPELKTLEAICKALGSPIGYLAAGEGRRPGAAAVKRAVQAARDAQVPATGTEGRR